MDGQGVFSFQKYPLCSGLMEAVREGGIKQFFQVAQSPTKLFGNFAKIVLHLISKVRTNFCSPFHRCTKKGTSKWFIHTSNRKSEQTTLPMGEWEANTVCSRWQHPASTGQLQKNINILVHETRKSIFNGRLIHPHTHLSPCQHPPTPTLRLRLLLDC